MQDIDTADHVHHAPSEETWVVAYVKGDRLAWCGWPCGEAKLADCTLVKKATQQDRDKLLHKMAAISGGDARAAYARDRLAQPPPHSVSPFPGNETAHPVACAPWPSRQPT